MKELLFALLSCIGAYFAYGIFAEHIGLLIKNKRETGIPIMVQLKSLVNKKSKQ